MGKKKYKQTQCVKTKIDDATDFGIPAKYPGFCQKLNLTLRCIKVTVTFYITESRIRFFQNTTWIDLVRISLCYSNKHPDRT